MADVKIVRPDAPRATLIPNEQGGSYRRICGAFLHTDKDGRPVICGRMFPCPEHTLAGRARSEESE